MLYFDNLKFEIIYNSKSFVSTKPENNYDKFILAYSTLKQSDIKELSNESLEELANYIYDTINFTDSHIFLNCTSKIIRQMNSDIKSLMIILLSKLNYKIDELYEWDYKKLFFVMFLEMAKNLELRNNFINLAPQYFDETNGKLVKEAFESFYPQDQYATSQNNFEDNSDIESDNQELIDKLRNL